MKGLSAIPLIALLIAPAAAFPRDAVRPATLPLSPPPDWFTTRDDMMALLGRAVGTAGDVNGDGFDDVIIGAPGQLEAGRVYVYFGSAAGLTKSSVPGWSLENGESFGWSVGTAGDVNGDGFDDVMIGGPGPDDAERVYGYYGSTKGLKASTVPDWTAVNGSPGSLFGWSVGTAGDVNRDGFDDVIVGAPHYDTDDIEAGEARVYVGSATGLKADPIWTAYGEGRLASFGYSAGAAGDVNGDGYDDIVVGSPRGGFGGEQTVYVYHGSASGPSVNPDWTVTHDGDVGDAFGRSVATAGDVNGDGFDDVIIGDLGSGLGVGAAYIYYGSAGGLSKMPDWTAIGDPGGGAQNFGHSVGTVGDVNGDGFDDVIVGAPLYIGEMGRVYLYHGSPAGPSTDPSLRITNTQDDAQLGWSVGSAGDVNRDGLDDIIVGAPNYDYVEFREGLAVAYYGRRNGVR